MSSKELLDLILDPNIVNKTCFLCFKQHETTYELLEKFELHGEGFVETLTLYSVTKRLLPCHDILLKQACQSCSNLLIRLHMLMKRQTTFAESFLSLVDRLNWKINHTTEGNNNDEHYVIDLSDGNRINSEKSKTERVHKQSKTKPKALVCDICGKTSKTPRSLTIHRKGHESNPCPYCSKVLKTHHHFNIHVRNHETGHKRKKTTKTVYSCNECNYKTGNKQTLEAHRNKSHLNLRPYVCERCGKGFFKKSNLTEHVSEVHSKEKQDTCETCGESFARKKCLIEHLRIHSGDKPYSCEICGDKFVTVGRRNTHVKRKHREKLEFCDLCGLAFSLKHDLNRHKRVVHLV